MKRFSALCGAALLFAASLFGEGYLSANDVVIGKIDRASPQEDGFVICASANRSLEVATANVSVGGEQFTQRFDMGEARLSAGGAPVLVISFPAQKGEAITVYGLSSSRSEPRVAEIFDEAGNTVGELKLAAYNESSPTVATFKAPATGRYSIGSKKNSIYIYQIRVSK